MKISKIEHFNSISALPPLQNKKGSIKQDLPFKTIKSIQYSAENIKANFMPSFGSLYSNYEMTKFLKLLEKTKINGETLLSQLDDKSFETDENFDMTEWLYFIAHFDMKKNGEEKSYLEKFLSKTTFSEFFYSQNFCPTDVIELINAMSSMSSAADYKRHFEILNLISDVESSKYSEKERVQTLKYFFDLKDKNGNKIFDVANPRLSKISTYKFLIDINPSSVDSSNLQMLLELVANGVVGNHIFEFLPQNGHFTSCVIDDIDKLYNAYINRIKPIDAFIPTYKTKEEANRELKTGDVFEINGEENIFIKTEEDKSIQLKITKEKYFELFPPIERFATTQNEIGNCWEISILQGIYTNPKTRHLLLSMFSQQGKNLTIKYPNGVNGDVLFENGELPKDEDLDCYSQGAKGFQLLEYADGKEVQSSKIRKYRLHLASLSITNPKLSAIKRAKFEEMINLYGAENLKIEYDQNEKEWYIGVFKKTPYGYNNAEVMGRDGGSPLDFFVRLGFENIDEFMLDEEDADEFLLKPENFKSNIVVLTTKNIEFLFDKLDMADGHAYLISGVNLNDEGKIISYNILNPWGIVEQTLTLEELKKYGAAITYANNLDEG